MAMRVVISGLVAGVLLASFSNAQRDAAQRRALRQEQAEGLVEDVLAGYLGGRRRRPGRNGNASLEDLRWLGDDAMPAALAGLARVGRDPQYRSNPSGMRNAARSLAGLLWRSSADGVIDGLAALARDEDVGLRRVVARRARTGCGRTAAAPSWRSPGRRCACFRWRSSGCCPTRSCGHSAKVSRRA